jgi:hypothetical protein
MGVGMEPNTSSVLPVLFSMSRCSSSGSASSGMIPRDRGEVTGRLSGTIGTRWGVFGNQCSPRTSLHKGFDSEPEVDLCPGSKLAVSDEGSTSLA